MTIVSTVLGIASLVVTIGVAQTAAAQIASQFDAVAATQVVIAPGTQDSAVGEVAVVRLPWDAADRVERLAGVEDAGLVASVDLAGAEITAVPVHDPAAPAVASPELVAASAGLLDAVRGHVVTGRWFDAGHDARGDRVAVLGERAAERLGIDRVDSQPSILVGDVPYTVIGIVAGVERRQDILDAAVIPMGTARFELDLAAAEELQVRIAVGAGPVVGRQAPIALDPNAPEQFDVAAPRSGSQLQEDVAADVNLVFLVLGALALVAGGLGIANLTMASVTERTGEIGLRRAFGASRGQIGAQFMLESVIVGLLGGLIGASVGTASIVGIAIAQGWTPVLDPLLAVAAASLGAVVGAGAGVLPARRATRVEPVDALRGGL
ncbi:ABC transporter permease [Agrococcus versicolor]